MAVAPEDRHPNILAKQDALVAWRRGQIEAPLEDVKPGQVLMTVGESSQGMYIIEAGDFEVSIGSGSDRIVLNRLGPGDVVGEIGLFARATRTATVTAVSEGRVRAIGPDLLEEELEHLPAWMRRVVEVMAERLHGKLLLDPALPRAPRE